MRLFPTKKERLQRMKEHLHIQYHKEKLKLAEKEANIIELEQKLKIVNQELARLH